MKIRIGVYELLSVQKKWEAYVGFSQEEVFRLIKMILNEKGLDYQIAKAKPNLMYDSKNDQIIVKTDNITFTLVYVTADPLTRLFANVLGTKNRLEGITLLSIRYTKDTERNLSSILNYFVDYSPVSPWKIHTHPRFQFAVLLQLITKFKWKKFVSKGRNNEKGGCAI
ncbi:hypothetical protein CSV79_15715 [Sporosarcina sp. P13]|uniref:hypothetical protein n=1 Tax=Sporosarcina sp. P13 TaxID=2048263 RepID=UPI000C16AE63|nr:hypothetical protein [Sporosarcina sp. P13]PIC62693.1 hypothetical protein CSV79_15715 [Sporosarcina sp. P13]